MAQSHEDSDHKAHMEKLRQSLEERLSAPGRLAVEADSIAKELDAAKRNAERDEERRSYATTKAEVVEAWMRRLTERAQEVAARGGSNITAGDPPLKEWEHDGIQVQKLPDDEQRILRVSVGATDAPMSFVYARFRGNRDACIELLRRAIVALEAGDGC